jgi:hypothetical protein
LIHTDISRPKKKEVQLVPRLPLGSLHLLLFFKLPPLPLRSLLAFPLFHPPATSLNYPQRMKIAIYLLKSTVEGKYCFYCYVTVFKITSSG